MGISAAFENSATISTTEYSLPNNSTTLTPRTEDGVYQVLIDLANMVAGDQYEIKLKEKITAAGTQRVAGTWLVTGAQSDPAFLIPSVILMHGWDVTMKQLAGAARTIGWSIRQVA